MGTFNIYITSTFKRTIYKYIHQNRTLKIYHVDIFNFLLTAAYENEKISSQNRRKQDRLKKNLSSVRYRSVSNIKNSRKMLSTLTTQQIKTGRQCSQITCSYVKYPYFKIPNSEIPNQKDILVVFLNTAFGLFKFIVFAKKSKRLFKAYF